MSTNVLSVITAPNRMRALNVLTWHAQIISWTFMWDTTNSHLFSDVIAASTSLRNEITYHVTRWPAAGAHLKTLYISNLTVIMGRHCLQVSLSWFSVFLLSIVYVTLHWKLADRTELWHPVKRVSLCSPSHKFPWYSQCQYSIINDAVTVSYSLYSTENNQGHLSKWNDVHFYP